MNLRGLGWASSAPAVMGGVRASGSARGRRQPDAQARRRHPRERLRARVPGAVQGAEPRPGGGVVRFARSSLQVRVVEGGAVFCGWDGAEPEPSWALADVLPEPDERAALEQDTEGGWRVLSDRVTVAVSRDGAVEIRTPGGFVLRRDLPPRWWEPVPGVVVRPALHGRWAQRSRVAADARFFGLGGQSQRFRLPGGPYPLRRTGDGPSVTMPVLLVVADAGSHLVFHDNSAAGTLSLREGVQGAGSGADRPGRCELRMPGGPLRYWVMPGTPARALHGWAALTGPCAVPPAWALGHQQVLTGTGGAREADRVVQGYQERGLPLRAVHLDIGRLRRRRGSGVRGGRFPALPGPTSMTGSIDSSDIHDFSALSHLAARLNRKGVRLVPAVHPELAAESGYRCPVPADDTSTTAGLGRDPQAPGPHRAGPVDGPPLAHSPDPADARARDWWGARYAELLDPGFAGVWHEEGGPLMRGWARRPRTGRRGPGTTAPGPRPEYALARNRSAFEGLCALRSGQRPAVLSGSGWAGMQRWGGVWSAARRADWSGLRASLTLALSLGLCGVPWTGTDVGGSAGTPSPELYLRWLQLAAYLPLFRTGAGRPGEGRREPWEFGAEVLEHAGAALHERERLLPYFVTLMHLARSTGAPCVRPLWWHTPGDRALRDCEDAFLLGDALLVAPVLAAGASRRAVPLPQGRWYDAATGARHRGPGRVTLTTEPSRIPVLVRAGSVLPVRDPDGGTELELWPPLSGATGGGAVVAEVGDGRQPARIERFSVRLVAGEPVVLREEDGERPGYPVRVRGRGT